MRRSATSPPCGSRRLAARVEAALKASHVSDDDAARIAARASVLGSGGKQDRDAEDAKKADAAAKTEKADTAVRPGKKVKSKANKSEGRAEDGAGGGSSPETNQLIFFGEQEVRAIAEVLLALDREQGAEFAAMSAATLEDTISKKALPQGPTQVGDPGRDRDVRPDDDVRGRRLRGRRRLGPGTAHALSTHKLDHELTTTPPSTTSRAPGTTPVRG